MVDDAERLAKHLTANADQRGYSEGYQRGLAEGRAEGTRLGRDEALQQAAAEARALSERWVAAIDQWEARRERMFAEAREDVVRFAFALAERIVHRVVRVDASIVRDQLAVSLRLLGRPTALQISVNPEDRPVVEAILPDVKAALGRSTHVHLHDDPALERGGCVLATVGGYVDASIQTQLDRMAESLLRAGQLAQPPLASKTQQALGGPSAHKTP
jgi:flagellar assembly protein FliH